MAFSHLISSERLRQFTVTHSPKEIDFIFARRETRERRLVPGPPHPPYLPPSDKASGATRSQPAAAMTANEAKGSMPSCFFLIKQFGFVVYFLSDYDRLSRNQRTAARYEACPEMRNGKQCVT